MSISPFVFHVFSFLHYTIIQIFGMVVIFWELYKFVGNSLHQSSLSFVPCFLLKYKYIYIIESDYLSQLGFYCEGDA
jgi:hypothetical protein